MQRRTLYLWFILAYLLKAIGGSWDVSYHFKYFRETTQIPHIVGFSGFFLLLILWAYMWKTKTGNEKHALRIFGIGILLSFIGIPFDEWWHYTFGLDLTIWSPPHMTFYTSTFITLLGVIGFVEKDFKLEKITKKQRNYFLTCFLAFTMAVVWFPLLQQEQGVISLHQWNLGESIASQELIDAVGDPEEQIYNWIPHWLYKAYGMFVLLFLFALTKKFQLYKYSTVIVIAIYLTFRTIMNAIYGEIVYPTSTIPYMLIVAAILFDILHKETRKWTQYLWITPLVVGVFYLITLIPSDYPLHPPMNELSLTLGILSGFVGLYLGIIANKNLYNKKEKE